MNSIKINITIPEANLKEIEEFCSEEGVTRSWLIREPTSTYITEIKEKKELERKRKEMEWAAKASKELRDKGSGFKDGKKGAQIIREFRDKE